MEGTKNHIHYFDKGESKFYFTKEYHDNSCQDSNDCFEVSKNDDYERGYQNSILEFQKQYNLRNRKVVVNTTKIIGRSTFQQSNEKVSS